jgi:hypothetical protein
MEKLPNWRHKSIDSLTAPHSENAEDAAIALWEPLANQIIAIVGEAGFDSLYSRSLHLTQSKFPWLMNTASSPTVGHRFVNLRMSFEGRVPELADEANRLLLTIFTDTLASLIGESLTKRVLDSAWGNYAHYKDSKE